MVLRNTFVKSSVFSRWTIIKRSVDLTSMRLMSFTLRLFLLLAAFTVWQAKSAYAHNGAVHENLQISSADQAAQGSSVSQDQKNKDQKVIASSDTQTKNNCNGSCCGTSGCCVSAAISTGINLAIPFSKGSLMELSNYETLPPGPGYPLLRPPRIFA